MHLCSLLPLLSLLGGLVCEQVSAPVPQPQANESLSQSGSQQSGQPFSGQSLPQVVQIPLGAAIAVPSINLVECLSDIMFFFCLMLFMAMFDSFDSSLLNVEAPS